MGTTVEIPLGSLGFAQASHVVFEPLTFGV
jgi:hypothetical protein